MCSSKKCFEGDSVTKKREIWGQVINIHFGLKVVFVMENTNCRKCLILYHAKGQSIGQFIW